MQDLPGNDNFFGVELHTAKWLAARGVTTQLLKGSGACSLRKLNNAIWCVLEQIFTTFLLKKFLKIFIFY